MQKDFTPTRADQWVVQELSKCPTPESVRTRLSTEERMVQIVRDAGLSGKFPNSERARNDLIAALRAATN